MNNLLKLVYEMGKNIGEEKTIRELSKLSGVPYTTAYRIIISRKDLFVVKEKANLKLCSLNLDDEILKSYLEIAEKEKSKEFLAKNKMFSVLKRQIDCGDCSLVLFGSRAEEKERKKSDIDLCIINKDGKKNIKFTKFESLFKVEINAIFVSRKEFIFMLKEKEENIAKQILKKHIILCGEKYFWEVVWNGI